jgi:hypothetical protein
MKERLNHDDIVTQRVTLVKRYYGEFSPSSPGDGTRNIRPFHSGLSGSFADCGNEGIKFFHAHNPRKGLPQDEMKGEANVPLFICWKQFPTWERVSLHVAKGHEQFREFWRGYGRIFMGMYEKGDFAGRETEVQEMMKALNDWWQDQNSDHPGTGKMTDFQATESRLLLALGEMVQKAFMAGFFEGFKSGHGIGPELKKDLDARIKEMLGRSLQVSDQEPA